MAKLEKTPTPGIFRRHGKECAREGRCSCKYVVVWRHRGRQHMATFHTLAEAREAKANRDAGDRRPTSRATFGDYFGEWIESYAGRTARGFSESTRPEYRRPIEAHAIPAWQGWKLGDVEPADVRDLFGSMRKAGASTSKIKKTRAALSAMFATAVDDGLIRSNPCHGVRIPAGGDEPDPDKPPKALSRADLDLFLAAVDEDWQLFFEFLAATGLRIGEATGLTWKNLDLGDRPKVQVREQIYERNRKKLKSRNGRRDVPLAEGTAEKLRAHRRDAYSAPDGPVFASRTGTPLSPPNVRRRVLEPAAFSIGHYIESRSKRGGLRKRSTIGFHTFRHTCASLLFAEGRNVKQVSEWLGHADPGFTIRTYIHLLDEGVGEGLDIGVRVNTGSTQGTETAASLE